MTDSIDKDPDKEGRIKALEDEMQHQFQVHCEAVDRIAKLERKVKLLEARAKELAVSEILKWLGPYRMS